MTKQDQISSVYQAINSLTLFRGIKEDAAVQCFDKIITAAQDHKFSPLNLLSEYYRLASMLLETASRKHLPPAGDLWQNHLLNLILLDNNLFAREVAARQEISPILQEAYLHDLTMLQTLCQQGIGALDTIFSQISNTFKMSVSSMPSYTGNHRMSELFFDLKQRLLQSEDWQHQLADLMYFYRNAGLGEFAQYWAFRWESTSSGYELTGIKEPDPILLHQLIGYERQRKQVLDNTQRLLQGRPAQNLLLYGDRGTGKSSTVKALLHEYGSSGLRLVQVPRKNLGGLQSLTRYLRDIPLRFIIFIDDLSFEETETEYKEFKTQLEGSLEQQPSNLCIYVTSNQRNLIKEYFGDRNTKVTDNGEIHLGDTIQEKLSLADRFGLKITFLAPDKEAFLNIVRELARLEEINLDTVALEKLATQWTLWNNERSGRTARQFIDHIKDREDFDIF